MGDTVAVRGAGIAAMTQSEGDGVAYGLCRWQLWFSVHQLRWAGDSGMQLGLQACGGWRGEANPGIEADKFGLAAAMVVTDLHLEGVCALVLTAGLVVMHACHALIEVIAVGACVWVDNQCAKLSRLLGNREAVAVLVVGVLYREMPSGA